MSVSKISWAIALLFVAVVPITIYHFLFKEPARIGFVKTGVLIQKYKGMETANKQFEEEVKIVTANIDTLRTRFEKIKAVQDNSNPALKSDLTYRASVAEREYRSYSDAATKQIQQRQNQLSAEVLGKINSYIQEYGKKNNYKMILGTTNDGSILYGLDQDDLTEKVLADLNASYSGGTNSDKKENE
ncbi:OmpH family outer membrane protein [Adhaeribacter soli]|uniref:OmpH family outer membrane protein n=1 Tax=Adhaeribacter soli TaxID=2607655 RepID=A0A5N1ILX9_9BACT|nr:OmpH family outer membrane protein [Adhaeribacter soli]KAA9324907.1 OmpH family outer membrane protein [Adhaeribacter soli]